MNYDDVISRCADRWDSFYLYDETGILKSIKFLKSNFPQISFLYSVKCNPNPHVLRCIFKQGFGADAASAGEVRLANESGLSAAQIYYSAPGKSRRDIESSIDKAILVADSIDEIGRIQAAAEQAGKVVQIGIRINPNFTFAGDGGKPSKFGIDEDRALAFVRENSFKNVRVTGIHVHVKSQELDADVLAAYYERMFRLAGKFAHACGGLEYVNMGSGMGVPYAPADSALDIPALGLAMQRGLDEFRLSCPATKVILEVGRYAVCKSGYYVTKVLDRKVSFGKTYLILKNTMNGFIRPSMARLIERCSAGEGAVGAEPLFTSKDAFEFSALKGGPASETVTLVGNLCTATDVIAEDIRMPHLECGDLIVITNAGSYAAVLSPVQFSAQEKPAELFLTQGGEIV
jgi:Diaminopimelate decarboxylase